LPISLAGDVVAAAVILPEDHKIIGLDDSKKVPLAKRLQLREEIMELAEYGIGIASAAEIDQHNIYNATKIAMQRALDQLTVKPDHLLIDAIDRKSTRLNSSHVSISYAVFCLKKKTH